jgi:hypothetical protein
MKKRHPLLTLALASALALAACGDDDDDGGSSSGKADPQSGKAIFEVSGSGKSTRVIGPSEVRAGVLEFQVKNTGKEEAGLQIVGIEGDHSPQEAIKAGNAWGEGGKLPSYMKFAGGTGDVAPGKTGVVRQSLSAGKYVAINIDSDAYSEFEVTGDGAGTLPSTSGTITGSEYKFETGPLEAGDVQLTFRNSGQEGHHVIGLPINRGKTIEEVANFLKEEDEASGPPPFSEEGGFDTAIVAGGAEQTFDAKLKAGKYALICFIPDRAGGPPHAAKGMVSEAVVE